MPPNRLSKKSVFVSSHPSPQPQTSAGPSRADLLTQYQSVRVLTEDLAEPLTPEDQNLQSMPDASPAKWHRAHTTWFFETFVLIPYQPGYACFDHKFGYLFNSYYEAVGERHPRPERGLLSRPDCETVGAYRIHTDHAIEALIHAASEETWSHIAGLITLGLHHEQQHQELLLMDILHGFSCNPTEPAYAGPIPLRTQRAPALEWTEFDGGLVEIGHEAGQNSDDFHFDNEGPRHKAHLNPFRLANRLVTNGEWLAFMEDGGYQRPGLWLSDGWAQVQLEQWKAPLYWRLEEDQTWSAFGLRGRQPINMDAPVCHISFYEADAYATWVNKRLPSETEWEIAAATVKQEGNDLSRRSLRPLPAEDGPGIKQLFGEVWEYTRSPYVPYPGFRSSAGAIGEYNGKFMSNQMVLRGGCCVTPAGHIRPTYRNFFYPHQRWMFAGMRLAEDG